MNVEELFAALSYGELNNLSLSLEGTGDIDDLNKSKIIYYTNQALTGLYTRFPHKTDYVNLELQALLHKYYLQTKFAVSNTDVGNLEPRYIKDSIDEPLDSRISKILSIYDEDADCYRDKEVLINDQSSDVAVKLLTFDGFYVKEPVAGNIYRVEYQCLHPLLNVDVPNDAEEIFLAPVLHEALTAKIASKVYGAMGNEDAMMKSAFYAQQYETICARAEADDTLQTSSSNDHDKLREGGWE